MDPDFRDINVFKNMPIKSHKSTVNTGDLYYIKEGFYFWDREGIFKMFIKILGGEGNGTPLQYSCLENPMDGGAW